MAFIKTDVEKLVKFSLGKKSFFGLHLAFIFAV